MKLVGLQKSYGDTKVFGGVEFSLEAGQVKVLMGESGCGKSTLLHCMAMLEPFEQGCIQYRGAELTARQSLDADARVSFANYPSISLMMQKAYLWPHLTCGQNIDLVRRSPLVEPLLKRLNLEEQWHRRPDQVSVGQGLRFAFLRAVSVDADILLLDEPTASLDHENSGVLASIIGELVKEGKAVCVVSHDHRFVDALQANSIMEMKNGEIRTKSSQ